MYLGFDLGTTNVKALVVDASGQIVAGGSAPVQRFVTADGGVEQEIEQIWEATCTALGQAAHAAGAAGGTIGRNIFETRNPQAMAAALAAIIHQGVSVSEAMKIAKG